MYPAQWYLLQPPRNITYLPRLSDDRRQTCVVLDNGSHLLKATLTKSYNSLKVDVRIVEPLMNFNTTHPDCTRTPSQLLTHDSSEAIAMGRPCDPFCHVPGTCQLYEIKDKNNGRLAYRFFCQCTIASCNDLVLILRPEIDRHNVEICDVTFWSVNVWLPRFYLINLTFVTIKHTGRPSYIVNRRAYHQSPTVVMASSNGNTLYFLLALCGGIHRAPVDSHNKS